MLPLLEFLELGVVREEGVALPHLHTAEGGAWDMGLYLVNTHGAAEQGKQGVRVGGSRVAPAHHVAAVVDDAAPQRARLVPSRVRRVSTEHEQQRQLSHQMDSNADSA